MQATNRSHHAATTRYAPTRADFATTDRDAVAALLARDARAAALRAAYAARRTPPAPRGVLVRLVRFVVGG